LSEDKDKLILSLFEELKKVKEELESIRKENEELSKSKVPSSNISLSDLKELVSKHELSNETKDHVQKAVDLLLRYAESIGFR